MDEEAELIEGLTISVGFSVELSQTLPRWKRFCDRIVVATDASDRDTWRVVESIPGCDLHRTDVLYANGASFNKGAALEEARHRLHGDGWVLVFDADILPPDVIPWDMLVPGNLYGAPRMGDRGQLIPDGGLPGYFWMFHQSDPVLRESPWFSSWKHAGCYDSVFERRWPREKRIRLPFTVTHLGETGTHWWGRGKTQAMLDMLAERKVKRSYEHERC